MTTPSGQISLSQVNTELGFSSTAVITMNDTAVRSLAGVPTGAITMANLQNKSNTFNATISSPQTNLNLITYLTPLGYTPGGAANIIIAPGVYIYSTSTGNAGLTIPSAFGAGKLTLVNNGYIQGKGGASGAYGSSSNGGGGGPALSISTPITLTNNSYIGGGGGGGGSQLFPLAGSTVITQCTGGGGAGGGDATGGTGAQGTLAPSAGAYAGGTGAGGKTTAPAPLQPLNATGGSAGGGGACVYIVPGPAGVRIIRYDRIGGGGGGAMPGTGGTGTPTAATSFQGGAGGSGNSAGAAMAGGGGWGAAGGPTPSGSSGGAAGNAINLNGNIITYPAVGTIWGPTV